MINTKELDCIIFDLGKVIINLDTEATDRAFKSIFRSDYQTVFDDLNRAHFFERYETGKISTEEFVKTLVTLSNGKANVQEIIDAWNAMLLDIPPIRFDVLNWAKKNFKTYCLSNTNELHIEYVHGYLQEQYDLKNLNPYFHQVHFSHEMGLRKPQPEIFQTLIDLHQINPPRTLFIDDTAGHLVGAQKVGLNSHHLKANEKIEELLPFK